MFYYSEVLPESQVENVSDGLQAIGEEPSWARVEGGVLFRVWRSDERGTLLLRLFRTEPVLKFDPEAGFSGGKRWTRFYWLASSADGPSALFRTHASASHWVRGKGMEEAMGGWEETWGRFKVETINWVDGKPDWVGGANSGTTITLYPDYEDDPNKGRRRPITWEIRRLGASPELDQYLDLKDA